MTTDLVNSWAFESYLPAALRNKYGELPDEIKECSTYNLKNQSTTAIGASFKTLEILKANLWAMYADRARSGKKPQPLSLEEITGDICTYSWFHKYVMKNNVCLAYLLSPPPHETGRMRVIIEKSLDRLDEVLALPLTYRDSKGNEKVNTPLIAQIHGIMKTMMERVHGGVIQRAQIHTHNTSDGGGPASVALPNMAQLEEMGKQLERLEKLAGKEAIEADIVEGNDS